MTVTRVWSGRREGAHQDYFCGQKFITDKDGWETVTEEYPNKWMALKALSDYELEKEAK